MKDILGSIGIVLIILTLVALVILAYFILAAPAIAIWNLIFG